ncbi:MAG: hypothetical protein Q9183_005555, partial [Haloplaca sp. 2 TL-2023]
MSDEHGTPSIASGSSTPPYDQSSGPRQDSSTTSFPTTDSYDSLPKRLNLAENAHPLPPIPPLFADRPQGPPPSPPVKRHMQNPRRPGPASRAVSYEVGDDLHLRNVSKETDGSEFSQLSLDPPAYSEPRPSNRFSQPLPPTQTIPVRQRPTTESPVTVHEPQVAVLSNASDRNVSGSSDGQRQSHSRETSGGSYDGNESRRLSHPFQNQSTKFDENTGISLTKNGAQRPHFQTRSSDSSQFLSVGNGSRTHLSPSPANVLPRPISAYSSSSDLAARNRSPQRSPNRFSRPSPTNSPHSLDSRPVSYIDLINVPYPQPPPAPTNIDNAHLQKVVGNSASLLSTKKTLDMYRANVKKTSDSTVQYEFAIFMVQTAQNTSDHDDEGLDGSPPDVPGSTDSRIELLREAKQILQKLSDRSYPFAQYYLADGLASGLFSKGKEDYDRAFPLFVAASKHGHAEAGYRAALCYEFAWGTRKDPPKAAQFY